MDTGQSYLANLFLELDGTMPFERFMKEALYHPRFGYYRRNVAAIGRRGDFSTSPTISDTLARAVARWAGIERKETLQSGLGRRWHVIEIGAGDGSLARDFFTHVNPLYRPFLSYHIVEISETLRQHQREKLPRWRVRWHDDMRSALDACEGRALIFSNELVDAFPPKVVRWNDPRRVWEELHLRDQGINGFSEEFLPIDPESCRPEDSSVFGPWESNGLPLADEQRSEIHFGYRDWQREWLPHLRAGAMLTIDYGGPFPELYRKHPKGTLRGYFQQVRLKGMEIYDRFGHQDLTADINFTDLQQWGEAAGLETVDLSNQRSFLLEMHPSLEHSHLQQQDPVLEFLMSPYGAGKAFHVLRQRKASA